MWCRSYRDHVIMAFPSFDTATNLWAPQANISWVVGTGRKSAFVRFAKRVFTEADAAACALNAGQSWVDGRLKKPGADVSFQIDEDCAKPRRENVRNSRSAKKVLTFDQFKSWVDQSDPNVSEQQLQKSYAALLQLRKHQHCSWADLIVKMRNSQAQIAPSDSTSSATSSHLPLTLRDWRRII
jgi:hypothetical protein